VVEPLNLNISSIHAALQAALGPLSQEDLKELSAGVVVSHHQAETIICHEGDVEYILYIIEKGDVAFTKKMEYGDQLLGFKSSGDFFGELGVLDHAPRAATVHATTDCTLVEIHEEVLDTMISRNPSVARAIIRGLTRSMRDTDQITIAKLQFTNEELNRSNEELAKALEDLRAAQAELLRRERLKRDLEIATAVHKSILPTTCPEVPNFEFAATARPAREIGGDLYDFIDVDQNRIGLVMADASGKSVQAALYMAIVKTLFLSQVGPKRSPQQVAHQVHKLLLQASTAEMFVTVFFAIINHHTRQMTYIRGGHDRPIFFEAATNSMKFLDVPGRFLGLLPDLIVEEASIGFKTGDVLVCYSDGVTDATRSYDKAMYGAERLQNVIASESRDHSAQELVDLIIADVDAFRGDAEQPDDMTLLVAKAL
jgi:sigma-B regulation protein RsbU (phosphoserine phosphatase)